MNVPLVDLVAQYHNIQPELDAAIRQVLESGHFILGPNVDLLEGEVASYLGVQHAIGVASGTDALVLALRALGVGPGDEVIVPAYTFFATAEAAMLLGATPRLVDIDPVTYCLDVSAVEQLLTERTKAIVPVHLYGHPADMMPLQDLARAHAIKLVEDNAQAFGAEYRGRKTGGLGDVGCLSFYPSKNLGAYGDGGMVVTNDDGIAARVRSLRSHGWKKKYFPKELGYNSRLDELQAAILRVKLRHLDDWNGRRRELAARYKSLLESVVDQPCQAALAVHVYHVYVVRVRNRNEVQRRLSALGVASDVYYPQPLHLTDACESLGYRMGDFPVSEMASAETLAIPLFPEMSTEQQDAVVAAVRDAAGG